MLHYIIAGAGVASRVLDLCCLLCFSDYVTVLVYGLKCVLDFIIYDWWVLCCVVVVYVCLCGLVLWLCTSCWSYGCCIVLWVCGFDVVVLVSLGGFRLVTCCLWFYVFGCCGFSWSVYW